MSIFHLSIQLIKRSSGRGAVAAAAYRAGQKLSDEQFGLMQDFTHKGVVFEEILLPEHAPARLKDRETLWNEVERIEKRSDAQLAREINIAFPREMTLDEMKECARDYIKENFVSKGMIADWAIHNGEPEQPNPHFHVLLTVRGFTEKGEWDKKSRSVFKLDENGNKIPMIDTVTGEQKVRVRKGKGTEKLWVRENRPVNDWGEHTKAEEWRASWAEHANRYLNQEHKIDHRSYKRQGIDIIPTIHEGYAARKMEKDGKTSERCEINRKIGFFNKLRELSERFHKKVRALYERIERVRDAFGRLGVGHQHDLITVRGGTDYCGNATGRDRTIEKTDQKYGTFAKSFESKEDELSMRIRCLKDRRSDDCGTPSGQDQSFEGVQKKDESVQMAYRRTRRRKGRRM